MSADFFGRTTHFCQNTQVKSFVDRSADFQAYFRRWSAGSRPTFWRNWRIIISADGHPIIGRQSADDRQTVSRWHFIKELSADRRPKLAVIRPMIARLSTEHKIWFALCLAHIKFFDRAIKILRFIGPIYPVRFSKIGRWRAFTLKICTADHSWEHSCLPPVDHRSSIGRQSDDILGVGPWLDDRSSTEIRICTCVLHNYVGVLYWKELSNKYINNYFVRQPFCF